MFIDILDYTNASLYYKTQNFYSSHKKNISLTKCSPLMTLAVAAADNFT